MIKNPTITEKLNEKTDGDKVMHDFLKLVLENESEGKQFNKLYRGEIEKCAEKRRTK